MVDLDAAIDPKELQRLAHDRVADFFDLRARFDLSVDDADAVFEAGWEEKALQDVVAIVARAAFMQRLVEGHGFTPMTPEVAAKRAKERIEHGYVNLWPAFRKDK